MVRPGSVTPSKKKDKEAVALTAEDKAEESESKRLRDIAYSRKLLSRSRSHANQPSFPSKTILSADGRDIVKKGHRKSKYLFSFPGLLSPVSGGKLGELSNLDSKNPILYVEFPQGRLKLFGTIMYPKNKYLTLHFPRGSGNIICEDCFESLIVFSQAWWIGTKEQNPEEARLPLPKSFEQGRNDEVDFTAGAGQGKDVSKSRHQHEKSETIPKTSPMAKPEISEAESADRDSDVQGVAQSVRQSARNAGRKLRYADSPSDSEASSSDKSDQIPSSEERFDKVETVENLGLKASAIVDIDDDTPKKGTAKSNAGEKGITDFKSVSTTAKSAQETNGKSLVLKQSLIKSFCQLESTLQGVSTPGTSMDIAIDLQAKVTTGAEKTNINSRKRRRKVSEENIEGSDSDIKDKDPLDEGTPSKRQKQGKTKLGSGTRQASTPKKKINSASKVQEHEKPVKDMKPKQPSLRQGKTSPVVASSKKGRLSAPKSRNSYNKSSGTENEGTDSDDTNDDSDEDYIG